MITWDETFSTGVQRIDAQHRLFLEMITRFSHSRLRQASKIELLRVLQELLLYAKFHFLSEENFLMQTHHPDLAMHQQEHEELLTRFSDLVYGFELDECSPIEIEDFLVDWFVLHSTNKDGVLLEPGPDRCMDHATD